MKSTKPLSLMPPRILGECSIQGLTTTYLCSYMGEPLSQNRHLHIFMSTNPDQKPEQVKFEINGQIYQFNSQGWLIHCPNQPSQNEALMEKKSSGQLELMF